MNALVAGNGSYIVRPCGHDLHGPTMIVQDFKFERTEGHHFIIIAHMSQQVDFCLKKVL